MPDFYCGEVYLSDKGITIRNGKDTKIFATNDVAGMSAYFAKTLLINKTKEEREKEEYDKNLKIMEQALHDEMHRVKKTASKYEEDQRKCYKETYDAWKKWQKIEENEYKDWNGKTIGYWK